MYLRSARKAAVYVLTLASLCGCAHEVGFDPAYVPDDTPRYIADGKILIVMPDEQQEFIYEGSPN